SCLCVRHLPVFLAHLLSLLFQCHGDRRDLHSFPTRRSSDLGAVGVVDGERDLGAAERGTAGGAGEDDVLHLAASQGFRALLAQRSEEHTSELQSRENLVCRLLLEKKKEIRWPGTQSLDRSWE